MLCNFVLCYVILWYVWYVMLLWYGMIYDMICDMI